MPYPAYTPPPTYTSLPGHTPADTPTDILSPEELFSDDFTRRMKPDWTELSGDWRIVDNRLQPISDGEAVIVVTDNTWGDYAVEVGFRRDQRWLAVFVLLRIQDKNNMMAFGVDSAGPSPHDTDYAWWLMKEGQWTKLVLATECNLIEGHVRVEAEGELYTCYIDGELVSSINDPTFATGGVGLRVHDSYATFDDFKVTPLDG
jgi:hypothetical protein